jgi:hypothetical protein
MSKVQLSSNASGTGVITLAAPNTNSSATLTLPTTTGTVLTTATAGVPIGGPAFSAYQSAAQTSIANVTATKITFQTEEFDTNNNFSSSRFTPTVAGYYQINGCVSLNTVTTANSITITIFKNGSAYKDGSTGRANPVTFPRSAASSLVYLNGSTDYVEIYCYVDIASGTATTAESIFFTYFNGCLVRSAT